ncbi:hypothetical protein [Novosphingobium malaysiense]|uniref:DUF2147 domain-containing protein n=1 Tax=Novosphingobium malaysiense TaxID=1348853 RepID=A0A0B1ZTF0_9SPHN|nr:hypothetical protein [Novosphingobium malaysiense]KHK92418.1 hypothetical protein LK12_06315 [Novosphingobium malaysiense]
MRIALLIAALVAAPAAAETATLTSQTGQWYQVFANDVESAIGRSVRVDSASVAVVGAGRQFRQAEVLLRDEGAYARGTTFYAQRSVNCQSGVTQVQQWSAVGPAGKAVASGALGTSPPRKVHWDSRDGKVLKFVCQGILPR